MKLNLRSKISILFVALFVLICTIFVLSLKLEFGSQEQDAKRYENAISTLMHYHSNSPYGDDFNATRYMMMHGFELIEGQKAWEIERFSERLLNESVATWTLAVVENSGELYLLAFNDSESSVLHLNETQMNYSFIVLGFCISIALMCILYASIIRSLKPLKVLREQIAAVAEGEKFTLSHYNDDEIGEIARQFEQTLTQMQELLESRQFFLRTIIHEFKTPIAKGRIITAMLRDKKQKARLELIFKQLDSIINEGVNVESIYSPNYRLHLAEHSFDEFLNEARKILPFDDFDKKVRVKGAKKLAFRADLEIFSMVVKNLIDNAVKYSTDGLCEIECTREGFCVKNKGEPLKQTHIEYLKAYKRGSKKEGMGLGLYIVDKICKHHDFGLDYAYEKGTHCFKITTSLENKA